MLSVGLCNKAHTHTHKGAQRDNGRRGIANNTLPWLLPGPPQEPPAHHGPICRSPEKCRGIMKATPCLTPLPDGSWDGPGA